MKWLFIGPRLLAGIGQVTKRYADLLENQGHETEYIEFGQSPKSSLYDVGFAFVLPIEEHMTVVDGYMGNCKKKMYMTICETETVNAQYGILAKYKTLYVASDFCKTVFERQFPEVNWKILHLYASEPLPREPVSKVYTFYTIGNVIDPRKNTRALLNAWQECKFPDARLVIKATCVRDFSINIPNLTIINGLLTNEQMEKIHQACDCYINCSHSEGVGMGAVEAALHNKPVIITDYGGLKEYVKTPWVVPSPPGPIGFDDFLFTKDLLWGQPDYSSLVRCMKECHEAKVRQWDHTHTKNLMKSIVPDLLRYSSASSEP
jgi:glycosyltransferase involved in cell wall biosynthesis